MVEADPSIRDTDKLVDSPSPKKKSGTPPRNIVGTFETCQACGQLIPLGSRCDHCLCTTAEFKSRFKKYPASE